MQTKEWTLMFYMASDNPLVISIVSQLKALKAAGFHHDVNVVAQFDPYAEGTPTHVFDVNLINKLKYHKPNIGFEGDESFVRNLIEDKLWRDEKNRRGVSIRHALDDVMLANHKIPYLAPEAPDLMANGTNGTSAQPPDPVGVVHNDSQNGHGPQNGRRREPGPYYSLLNFLNFCAERYPAKRYMLFIIGHGVVVGNDVFLFDSHADEHSITLAKMGDALSKFKEKIGKESSFELVSFNSCSVSSLEVAYELKGLANYMLASQGPTFVGSWPYREILIRIFREVEENRGNTRELINDIYQYCLHNSSDYLLAGYSFQLTLCDLSRVSDLNKPMQRLSTALVKALAGGDRKTSDAASTFIVLYSHWRSQSFFDEMYTDLYDFCFCIVDRCERIVKTGGELTPLLEEIWKACIDVMDTLAKPDVIDSKPGVCRAGKISEKPTVITASDYVGPAYQYSRGLSVYFPWTRPSEDSQIMQEYETYKFHLDLEQVDHEVRTGSWFDFLEAYFKVTERFTKREEIGFQVRERQDKEERRKKGENVKASPEALLEVALLLAETPEQELQEDIGNLIYCGEGPLSGMALAGNKTDPWDKTGDDRDGSIIKNFPRDTRAKIDRRRQAQKMPLSDTLLGAFFPTSS
jgi:Clostripain family